MTKRAPKIGTSPGGRPVKEKRAISDRIGEAIGVVIALSVGVLVVTVMGWTVTWMITHFPG